MAKTANRHVLFLLAVPSLLCGFALWMAAQETDQDDNAVIRKVVDMVQLNVAVTDAKGNYVTGLRPSDFAISEDKISQTIATFEEGNEAPRIIAPTPGGAAPVAIAAIAAGRRLARNRCVKRAGCPAGARGTAYLRGNRRQRVHPF